MAESVDRKLEEIFQEGYKIFDSLDKRQDPTNSPEFQAEIKKCIALFEDSTRLVSLSGLFSTNEQYDEISTNNLRYLLCPYFLAQLHLKICERDRKDLVEIAEIYYKDFLKRCAEYGLCKDEETSQTVARVAPEAAPLSEAEQLYQMARSRNAKLDKYREKKELDDQIKLLKIAMEQEHIEEETKRDFYLKLLKSCILETRDELSSIESEKGILEHLTRMRESGQMPEQRPAKRPPLQPLRPIIITKDAAQKAVFGAGYPSMPTMTVDEFYEQRVREGIFPNEKKAKEMAAFALQNRTEELDKAMEEQEEREKEEKIDQDDPEQLERARRMDDFKDDHRRGYGNRYNRS